MVKLTFEDFQQEALRIIAKRKNSWTLSTVSWEDVSQILLTRIWKKFHLYDQTRRFENWANTLISSAMKNLLRDNCYKFQRPCLNCAYNLGGDSCGFTKNNTQCKFCPLYANWEKKKKNLFNIKATVAIEHHSQTVNNIQSDFLDIDKAKKIIDKKILENLDSSMEEKMYNLMFIKNLPFDKVDEMMKIQNKSLKNKVEYVCAEDFKKKVVALAKLVIRQEGLAT